MKTTITTSGDFTRAVEIAAIADVPGLYKMQFSSQLSSARNPQEWQNNFGLVLQKIELESLRDLIAATLFTVQEES